MVLFVCLLFFGRKSFAVVFAKICAHVVQFLLQLFLCGMQFLSQMRRCIVDKFTLCFDHFSHQIFAVFLCKNGGVEHQNTLGFVANLPMRKLLYHKFLHISTVTKTLFAPL